MTTVLSQVEQWEPETVVVGVSDPHETLGLHGPPDQVFPLASVTKLFSAYATLIAVQDGFLHLDEPAGEIDGVDFTVRHLLAHASGLAPDADGPSTRPGTRRTYSNHGFEVLGELVSARTGVAFADHLDLEVIQPLGLRNTNLEGSPAHGARGSVNDLLRFARELLAPTLVDGELFDTATSVVFPGLDGVLPGFGRQSPNDWGLGFEIRDDKDPHWTSPNLSPTTFGHFGRSGSYLWVDPERRLASVGVADRDFGDWAIQGWPQLSEGIIDAFG